MYNWRVETFNNLLYLDVMTHEHAYIFDSNQCLDYDFNMFHRYLSHVNDNGIQSIFNNLQKLITEIGYENKINLGQCAISDTDSDKVDPADDDSIFFRD